MHSHTKIFALVSAILQCLEFPMSCQALGTCRTTHYGWTYPCSSPPSGCFPADSTVMLDGGGATTMDNLQPGQTVMTVSDGGALVPTKVLGFLQKKQNMEAMYLHLTTEFGHKLKLTANHLLYATTGNETNSAEMKMAGNVEVGDYLFVSHQGKVESSVIVNITYSKLTGLFIPMTEHGTLLVDGVLASCYASVNHDLAHAAMTPLRWFPQLFDVLPMTEDGQHSYAMVMKWLGRTVLPRSWLIKTSKRVQKSDVGFDGIGVIRAAGFAEMSGN